MVEGFRHLGYPDSHLLGVAKLLGVAALLTPPSSGAKPAARSRRGIIDPHGKAAMIAAITSAHFDEDGSITAK